MARRVAALSFAALLTGLAFAPGAHATGTNLILNGDFETAVNPHPDVPTDPNKEGVIPKDWAFEGAAGLFDYGSVGDPHTGTYNAAISDPASGGEKVHQQPVSAVPPVDVDLSAKNQAKGVYSVAPAWRPVNPIGLPKGGSYTISGWYAWQTAAPSGDGAMVRLRWLDANGLTIRTDEWRMPATHENQGWTPFSAVTTAPANAVKALPLFGTFDNVSIIQLRWDDVSLATTT
jgi:hypothetical protein